MDKHWCYHEETTTKYTCSNIVRKLDYHLYKVWNYEFFPDLRKEGDQAMKDKYCHKIGRWQCPPGYSGPEVCGILNDFE
jgi:hypothetical protein